MAITEDKLRVIRTSNTVNNTNLVDCDSESLIINISEGIFIGNGTSNPEHIANLSSLNAELSSDSVDDVVTNTYVKYTQQSLTDAQKAQVRENIGIVDLDSNVNDILQAPITGMNTIEFSDTNKMQPDVVYVALSPVGGFHITELELKNELSNEYTLYFKTSENVTPSYVPNNFIWANSTMPEIEANTTYEMSITATKNNNSFIYKIVIVPFGAI